ncbi:MAG: HAMP domain-containing histidine kinase [Planctomycetaceae bacterium]|nr:HAMP domain-containing histidine kinase [Planctomycetales bacterium]MCB9920873.1 HAMP domain-containing histidine kinase [Planctomycetaceae bacterium]
MFARCSIRHKLLIGACLLCLIVCALSISGLLGVNSYRGLVRTVSQRAAELPLADELTRSVAELRITFSRFRPTHDVGDSRVHNALVHTEFGYDLADVNQALKKYREQLALIEPNGTGISDNREEVDTVTNIQRTLERIEQLSEAENWVLDTYRGDHLREELDVLYQQANTLPGHLQGRMQQLKGNARGAYHTLIGLTWATTILSLGMLGLLVRLFYTWVFRPMQVLITGSRIVASGKFEHRIQLNSDDEMAELAAALNDMTTRFCEIRDDLDQQVKQRTKEVVRSEQLASVGFLAAGVSHEINNPLAIIAWSAEALESRLHEIIYTDDLKPDDEHNEEITVLKNYLRRIQDEAFRCKGITEKLLDFSRLGDVDHQNTDLRDLTNDVIEMVRHIGSYKHKHINFQCSESVVACVNSQEIKQVLLNLLTNALDSLDKDGTVTVELGLHRGHAKLIVRDDGCGMDSEVLEHLFEPFFTRRRDGQGTGLGLSISYRIVIDHGGKIEATSEGPGKGSQFCVLLPLVGTNHETEQQRRYQVA